MPTKPRTKKPAAKPQRKPRKPRQANPSAEEIGCVIGRHAGYTLASCLDDLLSLRDNPGFDAVAGSTVEKLGDGVTGYRANHATETVPARISPVGEALATLRNAVTHAEVITDRETEHLQSARVLAPSPDNPGVGSCETVWTPSLASDLQALAERIHADNYRRANMLDRLEL